MKIASLFDRFLYYLSVPKCVSCGSALPYGTDALCTDCRLHFENQKMRNCSICARRLSRCVCPNEFLDAHYVHRLIKVVRYVRHDETPPGNRLIYNIKRENRADVREFMAEQMAQAFRASAREGREYVFTNVPRRRQAIVEYGFDHSALLARMLARKLGGEYLPLLKSHSKRQQKDTVGNARMKNAEFSIASQADLTDRHLVIVDDVVTSGASMANAAMLLKSLGARSVTGLTFAIAYNDPYSPPQASY